MAVDRKAALGSVLRIPKDDGTLTEMKIRIPKHLVIKMHSLKLFLDKPVSVQAAEALDQYFDALAEEYGGARRE